MSRVRELARRMQKAVEDEETEDIVVAVSSLLMLFHHGRFPTYRPLSTRALLVEAMNGFGLDEQIIALELVRARALRALEDDYQTDDHRAAMEAAKDV